MFTRIHMYIRKRNSSGGGEEFASVCVGVPPRFRLGCRYGQLKRCQRKEVLIFGLVYSVDGDEDDHVEWDFGYEDCCVLCC